ncbi:basic secretory family protein [Granulicella cerasi]|uniref:Basic secretory family protein n=1 Tax=Granulicella cerasi TaxID=741063 RepID=A0ABW1Z8U9_9BACT|nr:basic secretory family protein [Granulicella cerasi]
MKPLTLALPLALCLCASSAHASDKNLHPSFPMDDGKATLTFDFTNAPDLADWGMEKIAPAIERWYPRIATMLASPGFHASKTVVVEFKTQTNVPAYTEGHTITANAEYFRKRPQDVNALVHEATHVIQAYGSADNPSWLVEGLDDYIRFYIVEPETNGATIKPERIASVHYNDSYRTTANFLHWLVKQYGSNVIEELNAAMRDGRYKPEIWIKLTGHSADDLGAQWKQNLTATASN